MTQRQIILIFGILVGLLALGFVFAWYSLSTSTRGGGEVSEPGYFDFLSFGDQGPRETPPTEEVPPSQETPPTNTEAPKLKKLTDVPVSGAIATTTKDGLVVRYIERATGHVYDVDPSTGVKVRKSQTTIPRLQEAFWLPNAANVVARYYDSELQTAETFAGRLVADPRAATDTPSLALDGDFMEQGIRSIAPSSAEQKIAFFSKTQNGSTLFTTKGDGTGRVAAYTSPVEEWLIQWFKNDTIAITTKPSHTAPGFLYFVPIKGGQAERVLPGTFGLTTLVSPKGDRVLYSETYGDGLSIKTFIRKDRKIIDIPTVTLPEKCVWSQNESAYVYCGVPQTIEGKEYPDKWYMGLTTFSDQIWKIDTDSGSATLISIPRGATTDEIDATNLGLTKNENFLYFINKKDGSLWALDLE